MATTASSPATLQNLQAAYEGESNARSKYLAFAAQADAEGFSDVASLFRAAARAEQIHAENHAKVIRSLGAEPKCTIHPVEVKSTAENLKVAIAGEEYERDVMYPNFIAEARDSKQGAAIRTFSWALDAEAEHAKLYSEALKALKTGKPAITFYVCVICGYTTSDGNFARCVICKNPKERFDTVA